MKNKHYFIEPFIFNNFFNEAFPDRKPKMMYIKYELIMETIVVLINFTDEDSSSKSIWNGK